MKLTTRQKEFLTNFNRAIEELIGKEAALEDLSFRISLIEEPGKHYTSTDDFIDRVVLRKVVSEQKLWKIDQIIGKLTAPHDKFPIWIELRKIGENQVELKASKRFRRFSELHNRNRGFPLLKLNKLALPSHAVNFRYC